MKTKIFIIAGILLFFFISNLLFAQETLTLSFKTKKITYSKALKDFKKGDEYQLVITGFNPYLYKVELSKSDSSISVNSIPGLFEMFSADKLQSIVSNMASLTGLVSGSEFDKGKADSTALKTKKITEYNALMNAWDVEKVFPVTPKNTADSINKVTIIINNALDEYQRNYRNFQSLQKLIDDFKMKYFRMVLRTKLLDVSTDNLKNYGSNFDMDEFEKNAATIINQKAEFKFNLNNLQVNYLFAVSPFTKIIKRTDDLSVRDSLIKKYNIELRTTLTNLDTVFNSTTLSNLMSQLINLSDENFSYASLPMQFTKEFSTLDITIKPWSDTDKLQTYSTQIKFPVSQKYFWGFSSGFYMSNLHNEVYSHKTNITSTDTSYSLLKEKTGDMEMGVSAKFHFGGPFYISNPNINWHLEFGPALSILKNPSPRLLLGGGIAFGSSNMFVISGGMILGYVDKLSSAFDISKLYSSPQNSLVISSMDAKAYFSLSYMFLRR